MEFWDKSSMFGELSHSDLLGIYLQRPAWVMLAASLVLLSWQDSAWQSFHRDLSNKNGLLKLINQGRKIS